MCGKSVSIWTTVLIGWVWILALRSLCSETASTSKHVKWANGHLMLFLCSIVFCCFLVRLVTTYSNFKFLSSPILHNSLTSTQIHTNHCTVWTNFTCAHYMVTINLKYDVQNQKCQVMYFLSAAVMVPPPFSLSLSLCCYTSINPSIPHLHFPPSLSWTLWAFPHVLFCQLILIKLFRGTLRTTNNILSIFNHSYLKGKV